MEFSTFRAVPGWYTIQYCEGEEVAKLLRVVELTKQTIPSTCHCWWCSTKEA